MDPVLSVCLEHPVGPECPKWRFVSGLKGKSPHFVSDTVIPGHVLCGDSTQSEGELVLEVSLVMGSGVVGWGIASANMITNVSIYARSFAGGWQFQAQQ
jgi:hypothetical protein